MYIKHVNFELQEPVINTYANFRDDVLPRIKKLGYNAVQLMAIQEHSYYASFGFGSLALAPCLLFINSWCLCWSASSLSPHKLASSLWSNAGITSQTFMQLAADLELLMI